MATCRCSTSLRHHPLKAAVSVADALERDQAGFTSWQVAGDMGAVAAQNTRKVAGDVGTFAKSMSNKAMENEKVRLSRGR
jgi:NAD+--asparagine ADP-ribosyltransferase